MIPAHQITSLTLAEHQQRERSHAERFNRPYIAERDALAAPDDPRRVIAILRAMARTVGSGTRPVVPTADPQP